MTKEEVSKLSNGLYKIYWKSIDNLGHFSSTGPIHSLAAIGDVDVGFGGKWICLTSWIDPFNTARHYNDTIWEEIERVVPISLD